MFHIKFTKKKTSDGYTIGRMVLNADEEFFASGFDLRSPQDYENQWRDALFRIVNGANKAMLIVNMTTSADEFTNVWKMWRIGDTVHFQESMMFNKAFIISDQDALIGEWETTADDGQHISDWAVPLCELRRFLERDTG